MPDPHPPPPARPPARWPWLLVALAALLLVLAVAFRVDRYVSFAALVEGHDALAAFVARNAVLGAVAYVALYTAFVALSLPGALVMTVAGGFLFGGLGGGLLAVVAATAGATLIFLLARTTVGAALARRAGPALERIGEGFREGAWSYLLFLRFVPLFPFWLVNLAPAVFNVPLGTFVGATAIGILPGTFAFAYSGAAFARLVEGQSAAVAACRAAGRGDCTVAFDPSAVFTRELLIACVALGCVALIPVLARAWRRRRQPVRAA